MKFEWDEEKNIINIEKHKISFNIALRVFNDPNRIEIFDEKHSSIDETRWNTIGMVEKVLFVVYTERGDSTRIISARFADKEEIDEYNKNLYT